jgi:hypothetical protein
MFILFRWNTGFKGIPPTFTTGNQHPGHRVSFSFVDCIWNVMAHAQKPYFAFGRKGRVHLNWREASVQSTTSSQGVRISGNICSNAGYTMFRGSVKCTGYPFHFSPLSLSLPYRASPCAIKFQLDSSADQSVSPLLRTPPHKTLTLSWPTVTFKARVITNKKHA